MQPQHLIHTHMFGRKEYKIDKGRSFLSRIMEKNNPDCLYLILGANDLPVGWVHFPMAMTFYNKDNFNEWFDEEASCHAAWNKEKKLSTATLSTSFTKDTPGPGKRIKWSLLYACGHRCKPSSIGLLTRKRRTDPSTKHSDCITRMKVIKRAIDDIVKVEYTWKHDGHNPFSESKRKKFIRKKCIHPHMLEPFWGIFCINSRTWSGFIDQDRHFENNMDYFFLYHQLPASDDSKGDLDTKDGDLFNRAFMNRNFVFKAWRRQALVLQLEKIWIDLLMKKVNSTGKWLAPKLIWIGIDLTLSIEDCPAGSVTRIKSIGPYETPGSVEDFSKKFIPLLALVWQTKAIMNHTLETIIIGDEILLPSIDGPDPSAILPCDTQNIQYLFSAEINQIITQFIENASSQEFLLELLNKRIKRTGDDKANLMILTF
ncbi:hypothetical protein BDA99DRAFT_531732 [Phascolomyces articulosus]|uniref:Uncharacterized protein n=1 Tax=Phascolomyces articulosus TaxID=60185 RepID=A0AAD5L115_9FUNG|nr:hypothetical protein BDA99DRAFT_531732 [Phascolomyces articulosus]